ncbi:MAG: flavodoxin family protein [Deltaproteobacteria bacterium]|nr:flavodoxin family protein [Deltaproteobacteria bacterium]
MLSFMSITVTALHASARPGSNSKWLLDRAMERLDRAATLRRVEVDWHVRSVVDLDVQPCVGCDDCRTTGRCSIGDDMDGLYPLLRSSQVIIVASPIFFRGLPSSLKAVVDRCQCLWADRFLLGLAGPTAGRRGLVLLAGASRQDRDYQPAEGIMTAWFRSLGVSAHEVVRGQGLDREGEAAGRSDLVDRIDAAVSSLIEDVVSR